MANGQTTGVMRVGLEGRWLTGSGLHVCLAQTRPPPFHDCWHAHPRAGFVPLLRDLLEAPSDGRAPLQALVDGPAPVLLALPELAMALADWSAVDALVRQFPDPLLLLAGFGYSSGAALLHWASQPAGATERTAVWSAQTAPWNKRSYNGGFCWIHRPGVQTRCVCFLKNFHQQRHESRAAPAPATGKEILRLDLDDLTLFPLICADMLCEQDDAPLQRIQRSLQHRPASRNHALVLGLLWDSHPSHVLWRQALQQAASLGSAEGAPRVLIVNQASGALPPSASDDQWRNLTGAYVHSRHLRRADPCLHTLRFLQRDTLSGVVLRTTDPGVVAGRLGWDLGATRQMDLWSTPMFHPIRPHGGLGPHAPLLAELHEIRRFLLRRGGHDHALPATSRALLQAARDALLQALQPLEPTIAIGLCRQVLSGPARDERLHADNLDDEPAASDLYRGLQHLAALAWACQLPIQAHPAQQGQLAMPGRPGPINLLVWSNQRLRRNQLRRTLQNWRERGGAPHDLLVLASTQGTSDWLDLNDWTEPRQRSPQEQRDMSLPHPRRVLLRPLSRVEDTLDPADTPPPDTEALAAALDALLTTLSTPLT